MRAAAAVAHGSGDSGRCGCKERNKLKLSSAEKQKKDAHVCLFVRNWGV